MGCLGRRLDSIGRENRIYPSAAIGFEPQDLKFSGEEVWLEIGDRNQFREFCTVHRGTAKGGGVTRVGSDSLFMASSMALRAGADIWQASYLGSLAAALQVSRVGNMALSTAELIREIDETGFSHD